MRPMRLLATVLCLGSAFPSSAHAAEETWSVRGELESLKGDEAKVAVIRLGDGTRLEVPLEALSKEDRGKALAKAEQVTQAMETPAVVKSPRGRPTRLAVPESLKDVEMDALACQTAADAVNVYRLFLALDDLQPQQREAATERVEHWRQLARDGKVRLGDEWVAAGVVTESSQEADDCIEEALEFLRIGNGKLAREMFDKAGRQGKENPRVQFILAMLEATQRPLDYDRAADVMADLVRRHPGHGAFVNDLAVCEILARRPAEAAAHFRQALMELPDSRVVAENVALVVANANNPRVPAMKMTDKVQAEFADLYRFITQALGVKPGATRKELSMIGLNGLAVPLSQVNPAASVPMAGDRKAASPSRTEGLGVIVAPRRILTTGQLVAAGESVSVRDPANPDNLLPATVVARLDAPDMCLLACDAVQLPALPLAPNPPAAGDGMLVVGGRPAPLRSVARVPTPGKVVAVDGDPGDGTFIHSADVPRGPGGGAIVDEAGRLVGMEPKMPLTDGIGERHGLGIGIDRITAFVKQHVPDLATSADATALDGAALEAKALAGTVTVIARNTAVKTP